MSSPCTWLYDLGSLTSKQKRCSLRFKLLLVKHHLAWGWSLSSHYRWCRRVFKETSAVHLRRPMRTPPFRRRGLRLVKTHENLKTLSIRVELTLKPYWVAYKKTSCDRDRTILLACHWRRSASHRLRDPGRGLRRPRNFQAFFLKCRERTTYHNSFGCNECIFTPISFWFSLFSSSINSLQNLLQNFDITSGILVVVVWSMVDTWKTGKNRKKRWRKATCNWNLRIIFSTKCSWARQMWFKKNQFARRKDKIVAC